MSDTNNFQMHGQQPYDWQGRGAGGGTPTPSCWHPASKCESGQVNRVDSANTSVSGSGRDLLAKSESMYLPDCVQTDCAGSRADSGVSMSSICYSSGVVSFDNLSSIPEDSHLIFPDITQLRINSDNCDSGVALRVSSIPETGSTCTDNVVYDSVDEGLGSEVCSSNTDSIRRQIALPSTQLPSTILSSTDRDGYDECARFQQNEDGDTFLHLAIIFGEDDFATQTIQMAKCKESLSIHNNLQQSPIHLAVLTNKPRLVQLLLARGAVVDARDRHGNTPLHMACRNGLLDCSVALITPVEWSSTTDSPFHLARQRIPQDMNIKNYEGETCLHMAAAGHHLDVIQYLTTHAGADINAKEGKSGRTIIHQLAEQPDPSLLRAMLRLPGANVNARTYDGSTPLSLACGRGFTDIETVLVSAGALMTAAESDSDADDMMDFNDFQIAGQLVTS